ncbi:non-ribosomal peptide synthetase [Rhodococcus sp. P1Y]|uniref:non-ribosomal peptide synthetase n=1 Tax=Rhodococcus sp. P1Y TaxID=1302308 RepID=UPI000EACC637|nr:non-ribosomal peptide synthetase [Rhodococcus sp. P1Y]AYJ48485.1 amino acid adenylation domain-containing protein [Rhodococcus sp. P1Y]
MTASVDIADLHERWNDHTSPKVTATVPELFAAAARATPDAVALVDGDRRLTYSDVSEKIAQLSHRLLRSGLDTEGVVGICLPRSAEMVIAALAIMTAGGAFVPVDPQWPAARRDRVIADSAAKIAVVSAEDQPSLPIESIVVNLDDWQYGDFPSAAPQLELDGSQLAYVIFTSGSTGTPKGAMIRHDAICERLTWQRDHVLMFGNDDASLFKAPLAFDISVNEILLPLVSGGRVVVAATGSEKDPEYLLDLIAKEQVTYLYLVSSMLDALLVLDLERSARGASALTGVRHVWCGGEVLTPDLFSRFRDQLTTTLYHGYGPAEATIGVSHVIYRERAERIATSIGRPNPHTQLYVLDEDLEPTPVGTGGELYAAGFLLGRGYVGSGHLTAGSFVANPFDADGSRMYRTGDLARWTEDGTLEFLGRADNQVKIRGQRLELQEVEVAISAHPGVRRAAVLALDHPAGGKFLAAYVTATGESPANFVEVLREQAAGTLPEYMVPSTFTVLDAFPVTVNGKLDRRALPAPDLGAGAGNGGRLPVTASEQTLARVFSEVLHLGDDVVLSVDDNFFRLGGHSLLASGVVSRVNAAMNVSLSLREVFDNPTIAELSRVVGDASRVSPSVVRVGHVERPEKLPMSFGQQSLWLAEQVADRTIYRTVEALQFRDRADVDALQDAIRRLVDRHEVLRTTFVFDEASSRPIQVVHEARQGLLRQEKIERSKVDARIGELLVAPLELATDFGMQFTLLRHEDGDVLVAHAHHMVTDENSVEPLIRDLTAFYTGNHVEPLTVQYADFAVWHREVLGDRDDVGSRHHVELGYWRDLLAGLPVETPLPLDHARGDTDERTIRSVEAVLSMGDTDTVDDLLVEQRATPLHAVITALSLALWNEGAGPRVPVGTPVTLRDEPELADLVGYFVNSVVVRVDIDAALGFGDTLSGVRDRLLGAVEHKLVPFENVVEAVNPTRIPGLSPIFQVMAAFRDNREAAANPDAALVPLLPSQDGVDDSIPALYDLVYSLDRRSDGTLSIGLDATRELFVEETTSRLLETARHFLVLGARHPGLSVRQLAQLVRAALHRTAQPTAADSYSSRILLPDFDVRDDSMWLAATSHLALAAPQLASLRLGVRDDGSGELSADVVNPELLDTAREVVTALVAAYRAGTAMEIVAVPSDRDSRSDEDWTAVLDDPFWEDWVDELADCDGAEPARGPVESARQLSTITVRETPAVADAGVVRAAIVAAVVRALDASDLVDGDLVLEVAEPLNIDSVVGLPVVVDDAQRAADVTGTSISARLEPIRERAEDYAGLAGHARFGSFFDDLPTPHARVSVFTTDADSTSAGPTTTPIAVRILVGAPGTDSGTRSVRVEVDADAAVVLPADEIAAAIVDEIADLVIAAAPSVQPAPQVPAGSPLSVRRADRLTLSAADEESVRARYGSAAELLPLSPLQQGLLYHMVRARESGGHNSYMSQVTQGVVGALDPDRLVAAVRIVLGRYPNLRSAFLPSGEAQVIPAIADAPIRIIRLAQWRELGIGTTEFLAEECGVPFDFEMPPLIRFTLVEHGVDEWKLAMTFEHILLDGWSTSAVLDEIFDTYRDPEYPARVRPASFRSYLDWLADQDVDAAYRAWSSYLAELAGPTLVWPAGLGAGEGRDGSGELHRDLDSAAAAAVHAAARTSGVTVGTVLQAAWGVTLGQLVGSSDVVFGNTVSGRPPELADSDRIIGLLFNTVPLRVSFSPFDSIRTLLTRVQREQLQVIDHPYASLTKIQAAADMSTMFDTLFVVQNLPPEAAAVEGDLELVATDVDDETHYPVTFAIDPSEVDGKPFLHVRLVYRHDAYTEAAAQELLERFLQVLTALVATLDGPVGALSALLADEAVPHTGIAADLIREVPAVTVADLLDEQVRLSGAETALVAGNRVLTFTQFAAEVNQYARLLLDAGVRSEHRVALLLPRDERMVVAMFAVFAVGAAYVPIDAKLPDDRIGYMLGLARPTVTLVTGRDANRIGETRGVDLDDLATRERIAAFDSGPITDADRGGRIELDHLAYIIFTSGSTGRPKGVAVGYRGLTNMYVNHVEKIFDRVVAHQAGRRMRIAHTTSFSFDASWEQLFWLLNGHEVHVIDDELRRDPHGLLTHYDHTRVDGFDVTPSYGQVLVDEGLLERDRPAGRSVSSDAPGVVFVSLGGEAVPERLWQQLRDAPGVESYNLYGPTEYTINALGADLSDSATPSVGTPIFNTRAYIIDENLQPTLPGVAGELYLAGAGIARGYWGQAALTSDRFVACPWEPGERMYRTGDLARWNSSENIDYLGRADEQVKIRGYRIEPDEVRAVLETHPDVVSAAVIAADHPGGGKMLAAYYTATDDLSTFLRTHAEERLPEYMVPSSYIRVDSFPLTPNGKLDRRALPAPELTPTGGSGRAAETDTERTLTEIFRDVLRLSADAAFSVDDDFFRLGGDSILSIQVVSRARRAGVTIKASEVFTARKVSALARLADARAAEESGDASPEVLSSGLWPIAVPMVDSPTFGTFVQSAVFVTPAGADEKLVSRVLSRVVDHHAALRGRLVRERDWRFEIASQSSTADRLRSEATSYMWSDPHWVARAGELVAEFGQSMNLQDGVLWQASWVTSDAEPTGRLVLVIHHLVVDGVSWRIIGDDLTHAWELETGVATDPLPAVGTSLAAWSSALAARARDADLLAQADYWSASEIEEPLLGSRELDPAIDTTDTTAVAAVRVPPALTTALLTDVPHVLSAEINDVLLGGLAIAVGAWRARRGTTDRRVLIGLEGHGREENIVPGADLSHTVGWFTSFFPVVLDTADVDPVNAVLDPQSAAEAVLRVKEQLAAVPDRGIGFGMLWQLNPDVGTRLGSGRGPQIGFNYLGQFAGGDAADENAAWDLAPELPGIDAYETAGQSIDSAADINIAAVPEGDGWMLSGDIAYASGVLTADEVAELVELWVQALGALAEYARSAVLVRRSPSDVLAPGVTQADLERWEGFYGELADVHPLTPLQHGLVLESMLGSSDGGVDVYSAQTVYHLDGAGEPDRFRVALDQLLERFPNMKIAIAHTSRGESVAVVPAAVDLPVTVIDVADESAVGEVAERDRATRFDFSRAPLVRATVVRYPTGHAFILTIHHALVDGWSMVRLLETMWEAYGRPAEVVEPDLSFAKFLSWMTARDAHASLQRWAEVLAPVIESTVVAPGAAASVASLPEDIVVTLDAATSAALADVARSAGATMSSLLQTVWAVFLNTITGQSTVVFGAVVSGRPPEVDAVEDAVGSFINTVPVVVQLEGNASLAETVRRVQDQNSAIIEHHQVSLAELQRLGGHHPLFDTLMVYQNYPSDSETLELVRDNAGIKILGESGREATHYPLTFAAQAGAETWVRLSYRPDLFDAEVATRFTTVLKRIVDVFATDPGRSIASLDVLPSRDVAAVAAWSAGPVVSVADSTLDALIANRVTVAPDALAVIDDRGSEWTYIDFDARVNALAHVLIEHGVHVGDRVAVILPRSLDLVTALFAVIRAGAAYVPIDPEYPDERIGHILDDAAPAMIVTDDFLSDPAVAARLTQGESAAPVLARALTPADTAYVIFTSGTTGRPKGVAISHRAIINRLIWMATDYRIGAGDRILQKTPSVFDVSVWEFFLPALVGATLVVAKDGGHKDPSYLAEIIDRHRITVLHFVPAMLAAFLTATPDPHRLTSVRRVFFSGEALPAANAAAADRLFAGAELHNLYGPTEAAVDVTAEPVHADALTDTVTVPIGVPVANTVTRVLDTWLRPVPVGVTGELYLGGTQLADGYLSRPDLTATRFIAIAAGERLYRTGDLVRWNTTGHLDYLGRSDDQVKIRGFRIELDEIRVVLEHHPAVSTAIVTAVDHPNGTGKYLAAYHTGTQVTGEELRAFLTDRVPDYMVPTVFIPIDTVPVTPNGKLDRRALPTPDLTAARAGGRELTTDVEKAIGRLFREVLGLEVDTVLSADDHFFRLGGHSLLAVRLVARANEEIRTSLLLNDVFQNPTVASLAVAAQVRADSTVTSTDVCDAILVPLSPSSSGRYLFCAHTMYGGDATAYDVLAEYVPAGLGIVGLQDPAHGGVDIEFDTLADLAVVYANAVQRVQSTGPYDLLGWSYGGHIMFAVAQELRSRGEEIHSLTIIDTYPTSAHEAPASDVSLVDDRQAQLEYLEGRREDLFAILGDDGSRALFANQTLVKAFAVSGSRCEQLMAQPTRGRLDCASLVVVAQETIDSFEAQGLTAGVDAWRTHLPRTVMTQADGEDHTSVILTAGGRAHWGAQLTRLLEQGDEGAEQQ